MYPWQLVCFRQMLRFVNKLRCMPDTTLARMALCDAIADHRYHQHNNWFAQLLSFCDKIQAPVVLDLAAGVHNIPSFNEAMCVARLKEVYYSVFTSAGVNQPKMHKYHTCFASHIPPSNKYWDAQPYLCTALNTKKASLIARFRLASHHLASETGTWRCRNGTLAHPTKCPWCSTNDGMVVQDEPHVFYTCQHFQHLRVQKPTLFEIGREPSLWRLFNEYDVSYDDIAWFLQETKLIFAVVGG
jgi:hypothetical protein